MTVMLTYLPIAIVQSLCATGTFFTMCYLGRSGPGRAGVFVVVGLISLLVVLVPATMFGLLRGWWDFLPIVIPTSGIIGGEVGAWMKRKEHK